MNAHLEHTTVMLMRTVPTLMDHSTARVTQDTLEMGSRVLVSLVSWSGGAYVCAFYIDDW